MVRCASAGLSVMLQQSHHTGTYVMLISLNATLITSLHHQLCLMCVQCNLKLHRSSCLCHCSCPAPPPPPHMLLCIAPSPSGNIPHLCNSHFASLSSPFPIPSLSLWGVAVMKMKSQSLCHCLLPHSVVHHLSIPLHSPPPPISLLPALIRSFPSYIKHRSTARNCSNKMLMVCKWIPLSHSVAWKLAKYRSRE